MQLAQYMEKWWALVNTITKLQVPKKRKEFLGYLKELFALIGENIISLCTKFNKKKINFRNSDNKHHLHKCQPSVYMKATFRFLESGFLYSGTHWKDARLLNTPNYQTLPVLT
jgi:5'(3')-deoxyribonucleotidase